MSKSHPIPTQAWARGRSLKPSQPLHFPSSTYFALNCWKGDKPQFLLGPTCSIPLTTVWAERHTSEPAFDCAGTRKHPTQPRTGLASLGPLSHDSPGDTHLCEQPNGCVSTLEGWMVLCRGVCVCATGCREGTQVLSQVWVLLCGWGCTDLEICLWLLLPK